jgi:hypothetical protein
VPVFGSAACGAGRSIADGVRSRRRIFRVERSSTLVKRIDASWSMAEVNETDRLRIIRADIAGASLLEITETPYGIVVGCPGCGAQTIFRHDEVPVLEHDKAIDCPVFRTIVRMLEQFAETKQVRG